MFSQGRLLNLSCSTVPSLVLSITATTQVRSYVLRYLLQSFIQQNTGSIDSLIFPCCMSGPGSHRAVQRPRGTIQTGRLPAAKEDGQVLRLYILK